MPITKSAQKALRQNKQRRQRRLSQKKILKETVRQYRKLIAGQKLAEAKVLLPQVYKRLDKAAKTNLIKKNKAARLKSRLTKLISQVSSKSTKAVS